MDRQHEQNDGGDCYIRQVLLPIRTTFPIGIGMLMSCVNSMAVHARFTVDFKLIACGLKTYKEGSFSKHNPKLQRTHLNQSTMKLSLVPVLALVAALPALALPGPVVAPVAEVRDVEKRDVTGVVTDEGLRYRTCPTTSCTTVGQFAQGTHISIECYTDIDTSVIYGEA